MVPDLHVQQPGRGVLTPGRLLELSADAGFENAEVRDLIPGLTKVLVARRP